MHSEEDHRNNFFAGGLAQRAQIDSRDREIIGLVAPHLQKLGLYFVGIDIIGDYLTEVNVTSPTGIQEMSRLNGVDGAGHVIKWVEDAVL